MEQAKKTAAYRVVADSGGNRVFRFTATSPISCDVAIEIKRRPECRVYLVCEDGHPEKQPALDKAVELTLIDGYCIGDLDPQQMRAWLDEATESMRAAESRDTEFRREEKQA